MTNSRVNACFGENSRLWVSSTRYGRCRTPWLNRFTSASAVFADVVVSSWSYIWMDTGRKYILVCVSVWGSKLWVNGNSNCSPIAFVYHPFVCSDRPCSVRQPTHPLIHFAACRTQTIDGCPLATPRDAHSVVEWWSSHGRWNGWAVWGSTQLWVSHKRECCQYTYITYSHAKPSKHFIRRVMLTIFIWIHWRRRGRIMVDACLHPALSCTEKKNGRWNSDLTHRVMFYCSPAKLSASSPPTFEAPIVNVLLFGGAGVRHCSRNILHWHIRAAMALRMWKILDKKDGNEWNVVFRLWPDGRRSTTRSIVQCRTRRRYNYLLCDEPYVGLRVHRSCILHGMRERWRDTYVSWIKSF